MNSELLLEEECEDCDGRGFDSEYNYCEKCHGNGYIITEFGEHLLEFLQDRLKFSGKIE